MDVPTPTPTDSPPQTRRQRTNVRRPRKRTSSRENHRKYKEHKLTSRSEHNIESSVSRVRRHRASIAFETGALEARSDLNVRHRNILASSEYNLESQDTNTVSDYNSEPFCRRSRSSHSSVETYPPSNQHRKYSQSSEDSHRTVPQRRPRLSTALPRPRSRAISTSEDNPPSSPGGNPLPTLDASPDKAAPGIKKMYLETKINMLEIIQSGLQLKLDMQCVREQFLSLLESYTFVEDNYLRPRPPSTLQPPGEKPISAGRARVRALYEARRARIQARRAKFAKDLAAGATPVSSRRRPSMLDQVEPRLVASPSVNRPFTATSSEAMSDSTFDDWELKSASSAEVLDALDCSNHRHNNSPSSDGAALTNSSPDSDIPLGGAANSSSGAGNSSSGSDGTGLITKMTKQVRVNDKENVKPELSEDARNNNLVNGCQQQAMDTQSQNSKGSAGSTTSSQKLETIREEYGGGTDSNGNSPCSQTTAASLPSNSDLQSFCSQDMDMDDNGYVVMTGIDPSIMEYDAGDATQFGGGGEGLQSRISGLDLSQELPRTCQNSYNFDIPSLPDTSIPIYTARNRKDEGEYVLLQSPLERDIGDYVTLKAPEQNSMMSFFESNLEPSMMLKHDMTRAPWSITSLNMTENFGPHNIINSSSQLPGIPTAKRESPVKYAKSELIKQLYTKTSPPRDNSSNLSTNHSLRDISNISQISRTGLHEAITDTTIGSMLGFGSPDFYPLNSTMKSVANQQAQSEDTDDTLENITDDTLESHPPGRPFDARTSFSEPSGVLRAPDATQLSLCSPKSMDDSYLINSYQPDLEPEGITDLGQYDSEDFVTPKRMMAKKPQLCKEHGVHPTFGGPCIFEDSFDVLDSSTDSEDMDSHHTGSKTGSRSRGSTNYPMTDTDCDSSYLSECVDDTHFSNDFGCESGDQYTYDARTARMKMMRRQTGQADIKRVKAPIGLSESDLHFNETRKHLSLEVTRASLPDLTSLSVPPSECSEEHDATLKLSHNHTRNQSAYKASGTHVVAHGKAHQQPGGRPLSISTVTTTTTDESPESNTGLMNVPVNSPNVTDTGDSSSRPTTDNYDYVDIPRDMIPKQDIKMPPPRYLPPRRKPGVGSTRSGPASGRPMSAYGGSVGSLQHMSSGTRSQHSQQPYPSHTLPRKTVQHSDAVSVGEPHGHRSRHHHHHQPRYPRSVDMDADQQSQGYIHGRHFDISDTSGVKRTVIQHSAVARNLSKDRKKVLAKKLKQFSNNFYNSTGNLQIKTLGHF